MAGLFFCLASDTVQGFYFARMQYSRIQAFTTRFTVSMQLYHPRHKTAHRALQRLFLRLHPLNCPQYQTDKSGHNTTRATLEGIHAPGHAQPIPDTTATPGRCAGQRRPPIIIRYIRGCRGAPCCGSIPDGAAYHRPCQRQRVSSYRVRISGKYYTGAPAEGSASPSVQGQPGGVSMLFTSGGWRSGTGSAVRAGGLAPSTRRGSPATGARRAARNNWRLSPHLFSGFRPIANRGQQ